MMFEKIKIELEEIRDVLAGDTFMTERGVLHSLQAEENAVL